MARRANHEGSIYQLRSGNWRAQLHINGKRVGHTAKSKSECRDWLKKMISQVDAGLTAKGAQQTLREYMDLWLVTVQTQIRPRTFHQYKMTYLHFIDPNLGKLRLRKYARHSSRKCIR